MPKTAAARKKKPRAKRPPRERGYIAARAITVMRLLLEEPQTKTGLKGALACSPSTIERLLADIEGAGMALKAQGSPPKLDEVGLPKYGSERGQRVFYSLDRETVRKNLDGRRKRNGDRTTARSLDAILSVIHLLEGERRTSGDLAKRLDCHRRTVERLLRAIEAAGFTLEVTRAESQSKAGGYWSHRGWVKSQSGVEVFYSLSREVVSKVLGV